MLVAKRRLALTMELDAWVATVAAVDVVRFVPVDNTLAIESVTCPASSTPILPTD